MDLYPQTYFVGQGSLYVAVRGPGWNYVPQGYTPVGDVSSLHISLGGPLTTYADVGPVSPVTFGVTPGERMVLSATCENINPRNLLHLMGGKHIASIAGIVTHELVQAWSGKYCPLKQIALIEFTSLSNTDLTQTYLEGADYEIDRAHGTLWINPDGLILDAQMLLATYQYDTHSSMAMGTEALPMLWVRFEGVNVADHNNPVVVDFYKVRPRVLQQFTLIAPDQFISLAWEGDIYYDETQTDMTRFGRWFRMRHMPLR